MKKKHILVMLAVMAFAAGCSSKPVKEAAPAATPVPAAGSNSGVQSGGVPTVDIDQHQGSTQGGATGPSSPLAAQRIIYFDFDSSDIRSEYVDVIAAHARFLSGNATVRVRLEGHTDERGSREYNIGLGERRAQAVKRALMLQGVQESQIATVSYGEERPAAAGSDEAAWSKNRRVEIVYIN
ncbi:MAG TPA: peptidoglycan-associated lipoprotein Pal [Steroidobacteraceae bacterium]|nr:peptidoglycan-associated lipoprotein Pal [Steroidobacteraceae bacterium]